jgi:hypothetical protein
VGWPAAVTRATDKGGLQAGARTNLRPFGAFWTLAATSCEPSGKVAVKLRAMREVTAPAITSGRYLRRIIHLLLDGYLGLG